MPQLSYEIVGVGRKHASAAFLGQLCGRRGSDQCNSDDGGRGSHGEEQPRRPFLGILTGPCVSGS